MSKVSCTLCPREKIMAQERKKLRGYSLRERIRGINDHPNAPYIHPESDVYSDPVWVTIINREYKAEVRFTLDGSKPTKKSPKYVKPFEVKKDTVVKARAFKKNKKSKVAKAVYALKEDHYHRPRKPKAEVTISWDSYEEGLEG